MLNLKAIHETKGSPRGKEECVILEFIPLPIQEITRMEEDDTEDGGVGEWSLDCGYFLAYVPDGKTGIFIVDTMGTFEIILEA